MWRHLLHYPIIKSLFLPKSNSGRKSQWKMKICGGKFYGWNSAVILLLSSYFKKNKRDDVMLCETNFGQNNHLFIWYSIKKHLTLLRHEISFNIINKQISFSPEKKVVRRNRSILYVFISPLCTNDVFFLKSWWLWTMRNEESLWFKGE